MSWWNSNEGQQYKNEMARQKANARMDVSKLEKAKRLTKDKKAQKRIQAIIDRKNRRAEKRRRDQKEAESKQKGWWR